VRLTAAQARQLALKAQGLWQAPQWSLPELSRRLGAIQLDTISVLARNHELIPYARLNSVSRAEIENHYWSAKPVRHFEYWAHAACIIPVEKWPLYAFRRDSARASTPTWHNVSKKTIATVLKRVESDGPVTTGDVGGGKKSGYWWDWSDNKIALEYLLNIGDVTVTRREGFRRIYDVSSRAIPAKHFKDIERVPAQVSLLNEAVNLLGVATKLDLLDVPRLRATQTRDSWDAFVNQKNIVAVEVEGWDEAAFTTRDWLAQLDESIGSRTVMLSPFDPLIWYRERMERLFGMFHRIEAYTPAPKRIYGYFAMPVLSGDELIARVDPGREDKNATFVAKTVTFEKTSPSQAQIKAVASAIRESAAWVNAETIRVDTVVPAKAAASLRTFIS
jgi:uncharacterized protein YcaQ